MEGSFGNEKNHYALRKVKARTEKTEVLWVYMGVLTSNEIRVAKQRAAKEIMLHKAASSENRYCTKKGLKNQQGEALFKERQKKRGLEKAILFQENKDQNRQKRRKNQPYQKE